MRTTLFIWLQYLLPHHLLGRVARWATRSESRWLSARLIRAFVRSFRPDMQDAVEPDPQRYPSFNAFFTRPLRAGTRPMPQAPDEIACPVDGTVSMAGAIEEHLLLQAKGHRYSLTSLLADETPWIERFRDGRFATLYLAPYNYHRIHMPLAGTLTDAWHIPGRLFSVNAVTAGRVPGLFARNERVVCTFKAEWGEFAVVLVGALFVGSMTTVWHGDVMPSSRGVTHVPPLATAPALWAERGAELGRFNMGSTVILLLPPGKAEWYDTLTAGRTVRVGEPIGRLLGPAVA